MSISIDVSIYLAMCDMMTWLLRLDESHDSMAPGFYAWGIVGVRDGLGQTSPRLSLLSRLELRMVYGMATVVQRTQGYHSRYEDIKRPRKCYPEIRSPAMVAGGPTPISDVQGMPMWLGYPSRKSQDRRT